MEVEPRDVEAEGFSTREAVFELLVPDAVLGEWPARVGLARVAVAEAGVNAKGHGHRRGDGGELFEHVRRATVDGDLVLFDEGERIVVEDVGCVDDSGWIACRGVAGTNGAIDFACRDGIHDDAVVSHEGEDGDVGAGFLGETDSLEAREFADALFDDCAVVGEERGAVAFGQGRDGDPGELGEEVVHESMVGYRLTACHAATNVKYSSLHAIHGVNGQL